MKTSADTKPNAGPSLNGLVSNQPRYGDQDRPLKVNIRSINLAGDQYVIMDELPGVYMAGVQYYDLKNIGYINNTGMATLIELLKSLLKKGIEVKFVNVNDRIKRKIKTLGLENILCCM
jgi:ABC-type transporter Mla MlaB component